MLVKKSQRERRGRAKQELQPPKIHGCAGPHRAATQSAGGRRFLHAQTTALQDLRHEGGSRQPVHAWREWCAVGEGVKRGKPPCNAMGYGPSNDRRQVLHLGEHSFRGLNH